MPSPPETPGPQSEFDTQAVHRYIWSGMTQSILNERFNAAENPFLSQAIQIHLGHELRTG